MVTVEYWPDQEPMRNGKPVVRPIATPYCVLLSMEEAIRRGLLPPHT